MVIVVDFVGFPVSLIVWGFFVCFGLGPILSYKGLFFSPTFRLCLAKLGESYVLVVKAEGTQIPSQFLTHATTKSILLFS